MRMRRVAVRDRDSMLDDLRVMENAALSKLNE